ncbi:formate dehydrogenase subunit gamma [Evansella vedderi]|uniref:Formate dehydrogenase subunit gamma n=1 Tax=Evansella vedderi TaxID=38282 RepID=A0ABT9ZUG8_9BACI|nr:cytochrome b/b6 domain-containing protein [Evansella vedderi]MDQ0254879.1 formate dehydrogenase subunit gamma [Evansella vedderi]
MKAQKNEQMVHRFNKGFIVSHWVQAISFFALYITALPLYTDFFSFLYPVFGGPEGARLLHRIFAVFFMLPFFVLLIFDRQGLVNWTKRILTWKKNDFSFFLAFPKEFFVGNDKVPKQDFFNAGEKLNSLLIIVTTLMLIGSGLILWFPANFSQSVVQWGITIHVVGFSLAMLTVVAHIFLSTFHPNSKASLRGIIKGDVPVSYAKEHHGQWYDELVEKGEIVEEKKKSKGA